MSDYDMFAELEARRWAFLTVNTKDINALRQALEQSQKLHAHLYLRASAKGGHESTDAGAAEAARALQRAVAGDLPKDRWPQQCLTYYAYYTDLLARTNDKSMAGNAAVCEYLKNPQIDVRHLSAPCGIMQEIDRFLADARQKSQEQQQRKSHFLSRLSHGLEKIGYQRSAEAAAAYALLRYWRDAIGDTEAQRMVNLKWQVHDLMVPAKSAEESILLYATVEAANASDGSYLPLTGRIYHLAVTAGYHSNEWTKNVEVRNPVARVAEPEEGVFEVEWQIRLHSEILSSEYDDVLPLYIEEFPPGKQPTQGVLLRYSVTSSGAVCNEPLKTEDIDKLEADYTAQALQEVVKNAVSKAFGPALVEKVVIDPRCGRFIRSSVDGDPELARELVRLTVNAVRKSSWWYISRPQIEKLINDTYSPQNDDTDSFRLLAERWVTSRLESVDRPMRNDAIRVLARVPGTKTNTEGFTLSRLAQEMLTDPDTQGGYLNINAIVNKLRDAQLLDFVEMEGAYSTRSELVSQWAQHTRGQFPHETRD